MHVPTEVLVAFTILAALVATVVWYAGRARRAIYLADDLEALQTRVFKLERHLKLTAGRLNSLAPPRAGTGAPGNGEAEAEEADQAMRRAMSRAELHAAIERSKRSGKG